MYPHSQHFPSVPQETVNTGPFVMRSTCRRCGGRGSIVTSPCVVCRGTGQAKQKKRVTIPVPAGGPLPRRWPGSVVSCVCVIAELDARPLVPRSEEELESVAVFLYPSHSYSVPTLLPDGMLQLPVLSLLSSCSEDWP